MAAPRSTLARVGEFALRHLLLPASAGAGMAYVMGQKHADAYRGFILAAMLFSAAIDASIQLMREQIRPRLIARARAVTWLPLWQEIALSGGASLVGIAVAAVLVNFTIAPGYLADLQVLSKTLLLTFLIVGLVLGAFEDAAFEDEETRLSRGDTLIVFSDGVTEATDAGGEMFGDERILAAIRTAPDGSAHALVEHLLSEVRAFAGHQAPDDDITVLVLCGVREPI